VIKTKMPGFSREIRHFYQRAVLVITRARTTTGTTFIIVCVIVGKCVGGIYKETFAALMITHKINFCAAQVIN
jgi:hypothetical protein